MVSATAEDIALLMFRCGIGSVMLAHGINHIVGGGRITGTARWFGSLGMRLPRVQAWLASTTEVGAGALMILGLFTPFAAAGVVGTMVVAWMINHRRNGFFIFRPGAGCEYVMTLALSGVLLGAVGPGCVSLDRAIGSVEELTGTVGLAIAAGLGAGCAALLLAIAWRPNRNSVRT